MAQQPNDDTPCPCCSGQPYQHCCQPIIHGISQAKTPLQLMRSRYTAYATDNMDYIATTMRGRALKAFDKTNHASSRTTSSEWCRLEIINAPAVDETATTGVVEFIAHYQQNGQTHSLHECSQFKKIGQHWLYVDGEHQTNNPLRKLTIGRNDICPCQSGKKYKKCCGA